MHRTNKFLRLLSLILALFVFILYFCINFSYISTTYFSKSDIKTRNDILELNSQLKLVTDQKVQIDTEKNKLQTDYDALNSQFKILSDKANNLNQEPGQLKGPPYSENNKVAYLTFDDGPSEITQKVLDFLKKNDIKATFFVIGRTDDFSKQMYKRIVSEGHTLALHTYSHTYAEIYTSEKAFFDDLNKLKSLLIAETGVSPKYMRFAGGSGNTTSKNYSIGIMTKLTKAVLDNGYKYFDWNVSSGDASPNPYPPNVIASNILNAINGKNELIVLMHDSSGKQAVLDALPEIIEGLKKANYRFAPIDDNTLPVVQAINN